MENFIIQISDSTVSILYINLLFCKGRYQSAFVIYMILCFSLTHQIRTTTYTTNIKKGGPSDCAGRSGPAGRSYSAGISDCAARFNCASRSNSAGRSNSASRSGSAWEAAQKCSYYIYNIKMVYLYI